MLQVASPLHTTLLASTVITSVSQRRRLVPGTTKRIGDLVPLGLARYEIGLPSMEAHFERFPISTKEEDQEDRRLCCYDSQVVCLPSGSR